MTPGACVCVCETSNYTNSPMHVSFQVWVVTALVHLAIIGVLVLGLVLMDAGGAAWAVLAGVCASLHMMVEGLASTTEGSASLLLSRAAAPGLLLHLQAATAVCAATAHLMSGPSKTRWGEVFAEILMVFGVCETLLLSWVCRPTTTSIRPELVLVLIRWWVLAAIQNMVCVLCIGVLASAGVSGAISGLHALAGVCLALNLGLVAYAIAVRRSRVVVL